MIKGWIVTSALSYGIREVEGVIAETTKGSKHVYLKWNPPDKAPWGTQFSRIGDTCFLTKDEAIVAAELMRQRAIKSATKKLAKLTDLHIQVHSL